MTKNGRALYPSEIYFESWKKIIEKFLINYFTNEFHFTLLSKYPSFEKKITIISNFLHSTINVNWHQYSIFSDIKLFVVSREKREKRKMDMDVMGVVSAIVGWLVVAGSVGLKVCVLLLPLYLFFHALTFFPPLFFPWRFPKSSPFWKNEVRRGWTSKCFIQKLSCKLLLFFFLSEQKRWWCLWDIERMGNDGVVVATRSVLPITLWSCTRHSRAMATSALSWSKVKRKKERRRRNPIERE